MHPEDDQDEPEFAIDFPATINIIKAMQSSIDDLRNQATQIEDLVGSILGTSVGLVNCHDRLLEAKAWTDYAISIIEPYVSIQIGEDVGQ